MNKLIAELERLYFLAQPVGLAECLRGECCLELGLISPEGTVRTMGLTFSRAADWPSVSTLCQALQDELELPLPAVSVSAQAGFQLWFSLLEPLPVAQAAGFLEALRRQYLTAIPSHHLESFPGSDGVPDTVALVPAYYPARDKWSAFIDPSMGSMFVEESGLDMAPNMDRQADLLAGFRSIKADDFARAQAALLSMAEARAACLSAEKDAAESLLADRAVRPQAADRLSLGSGFQDPQSFLLAVMNDPAASAAHRIDAAKALLPYVARVDAA